MSETGESTMRLSSRFTVLFRTVLPASWLVSVPVVALFHIPNELEPGRWFMLAGLAVLLLQSAVWFVHLRDVEADRDGLVVSGGRSRVRVPWGHVAGIAKPWWGRGQFARIEFRASAAAGRSALVLLPLAPLTRWKDHFAVQTVAAHVAAARADGVGARSAPLTR